MKTYITLFLFATFASLILTPVVRRLCIQFNWLDVPGDGRRVHRKAVPRLGGVAVFASIAVTVLALPFVDNTITQALANSSNQLLAVIVPALIVFVFGVFDDLHGASARWKFLAQGVAGVLFYFMGGRIDAVSLPFFDVVFLPTWLSLVVTVVWVVGVSNAFNLIDGIDGLATGAALFAAVVMLMVALAMGHVHVVVVMIVLSGALTGFLPYNFNPASIFLGDSGSLFIGFVLAALSIQGAQKASTAVALAIPLIAFGLPILDTGFSMARRFIGGRPMFEGDREHVHHMLLARGWSQRRVVLVLYSTCALFGIVALLFVQEGGSRVPGLVLLIIGAATVFIVGRLRYHEVDEIKSGVRYHTTDRRERLKNNIEIRRASTRLAKATSIAEIHAAINDMLEHSLFDYALLEFSFKLKGRSLEEVYAREIRLREKTPDIDVTLDAEESKMQGRTELLGDTIRWHWQRKPTPSENQVVGETQTASPRTWSLRLPLATVNTELGFFNLYRNFNNERLLLDINHLWGLLQPALSRAIERVCRAAEHQPAESNLAFIAAASNTNLQSQR